MGPTARPHLAEESLVPFVFYNLHEDLHDILHDFLLHDILHDFLHDDTSTARRTSFIVSVSAVGIGAIFFYSFE